MFYYSYGLKTIKVYNKDEFKNLTAAREFKILKKLSESDSKKFPGVEFILKFIDSFFHDNSFSIVTEYYNVIIFNF